MTKYSVIKLNHHLDGMSISVGDGFDTLPAATGTVTEITKLGEGAARITVQPKTGAPVLVDIAGVALAIVSEDA